jgi:Zn finger protein HypA/HybF involved in hydrogenase expression
MQKGDVECLHCHAGFKRIEVSSMKGEPGEYHCPICNSTVDRVIGSNYVAYRLTVRPECAIVDAPRMS